MWMKRFMMRILTTGFHGETDPHQTQTLPGKLEHSRVLDVTIIENLRKELGIGADQVYFSEAPLELSFFSQIQDSLREKRELFFEKRVPQQPACIRNDLPVIDQIEEKDWFLSFPYESMKPFIRL